MNTDKTATQENDADTPMQFLPPVLEFDELYLYPTEESQKASTEYQAYLRECRTFYAAKADKEREQEREAGMEARRLAAEQGKLQAEANAIEQETRRKNELQFADLETRQREFAAVAEKNKELQALADQKSKEAREAEANAKQAKSGVDGILSGCAVACLVLVIVVGAASYYFGYSKGGRREVDAQLAKLGEHTKQVESQNADLEAQVRRLTPPSPPDVDPEALQPLLLADYKEMDAAHDQEDTDKLYSFYSVDYSLVTNGFSSSLSAVKRSNEKDFFRDDTLHQQITEIKKKPAASSNSETSTSATSSDSGSSGSHSEDKPAPVVEIIDKDTVIIPVQKTIFTWKRVAVVSSPPPSSSSGEDASGSSTDSATTGASSPSTEERITQYLFDNRDTWVRKDGRWSLAKTEIVSVSETAAVKAPPTLKCRNVSCGDYYYQGIGTPFEADGKVIKRCPLCHRRLYLDGVQ